MWSDNSRLRLETGLAHMTNSMKLQDSTDHSPSPKDEERSYIKTKTISISYNTDKSTLPDIYAQYLRAFSAQGRMRIYRAMHECLCYN